MNYIPITISKLDKATIAYSWYLGIDFYYRNFYHDYIKITKIEQIENHEFIYRRV